MTDVVAYCRFSSDNQREESIDAQIRAIKEYCRRHDYNLIKVYADEAKSATTDNRPQFLAMVADSKTKAFSYVIVHKLDRFSRNRYDSAIYKNELKKSGVMVLSVLENLDDSPESIILESVLEGMSEYYSRNLAREVIKGKMETAYQCKHNGGIAPLGYDVAPDKTYVINPHEADAVKTIFKMYTEGASYSEIADTLHNQGYRTKTGNKFAGTAFYSILTNEKYIGTYVFNRTVPQQRGGKRSNQSRDDSEILRIPDGIPAVIDKITWGAAQKLLERRKTMSGKGERSAKEVYLLAGIIKCGNCGGAMVGARRSDGRNKTLRITYECNTRKRLKTCKTKAINRDYVEDLVISYLENNLFSEQAIEKVKKSFADLIKTSKAEIPVDITFFEKELAETKKQISNIVDAIASGMLNPSMKEKMDDLEARQNTLVLQLEEAKLQLHTSTSVEPEFINNYLASYRNIKSKSREEQKQVIQTFIREVVVYDGDNDKEKKITIHGAIPSLSYTFTTSEKANEEIRGLQESPLISISRVLSKHICYRQLFRINSQIARSVD